MQVVAALFFWLNMTDTAVATGWPSGGTRDIRFCKSGPCIKKLLRRSPNHKGIWNVKIQANAAAGISARTLRLSEYRGKRLGECAIPGQHPDSRDVYPLWEPTVRRITSDEEMLDAIAFFRDANGGIHVRVIPRERVGLFPMKMRRELEEMDPCARLVRFTKPQLVKDVWFARAFSGLGPSSKVGETKALIDELKQLSSPKDKLESRVARHKRSRRLAEGLKRAYGYKCQLCDEDAPEIRMEDGRSYVEVHHITGLSEIDPQQVVPNGFQEEQPLSLDRLDNLVVLCPFHHAMLHYDSRKFVFERKREHFRGREGSILKLQKNLHLE